MKVSINSPKNSSETDVDEAEDIEDDIEILKERDTWR